MSRDRRSGPRRSCCRPPGPPPTTPTRAHREADRNAHCAPSGCGQDRPAAAREAAAGAAANGPGRAPDRRRAELDQQLAGAPPLADLPDLLARRTGSPHNARRPLAADKGPARRTEDRPGGCGTPRQAVAADRDALGTARDLAAAWGPPAFDGTRLADDLAGCWADLVTWAQEAAEQARDDAAAAQEAAAAAGRDADRRLARLDGRVGDARPAHDQVAGDPRAAERLVAVAHTQAVGTGGGADEGPGPGRRPGGEDGRPRPNGRWWPANCARCCVRTSSGNGWRPPRWTRWSSGASDGLRQLSDGQFTLTHDKGDFFVIDHFDADSSRSVKTLSGGETFQASLALALALSEQLAALAIGGSARLDSIFLDEGFGTLDPESLETVAATLETLAQGDRMVGVVTHVAALAERTPVRFSVSHDNRTSRIEREAL